MIFLVIIPEIWEKPDDHGIEAEIGENCEKPRVTHQQAQQSDFFRTQEFGKQKARGYKTDDDTDVGINCTLNGLTLDNPHS